MAKSSKSSKKLTASKFAPVGLIISGLALLSVIILLVIKLLIYAKIYTPTNEKVFSTALIISAGVLLIGLAVYALLAPENVRNFLSGRQARHGSNTFIMLIAFILILVVVNGIVFKNPFKWDLTEDKIHTVAPETTAALKALQEPVHVLAFYTTRIDRTTAQTLLDNVKEKSDGKLTYEFVDPEANQSLARQYTITQDGTLVLTMGDKKQLITTIDEQNFTNALIKLEKPGERTVYFLTGHGERNIDQPGDTSYTSIKTLLESKNYTVKTLSLLTEKAIPADALAVIIAGPTKQLSTDEVVLLRNYVATGKALVVLEDPIVAAGVGETTPDPLLDYLSTDWNITVNKDVVVDPTTNYMEFAISNHYGNHAITDSLESQNLATVFPYSESLTLSTTNKDVTTTSLVETISGAWGETDFSALQDTNATPVFQTGKDLPGPLTLAAAAESTSGKGRVVVFGNSTFADDTFISQVGNSNIFVNSINWAAGQEDLISLTSKSSTTRTMPIIPSFTILVIALTFIIILPGLIVAGGIISWLVRRSRG